MFCRCLSFIKKNFDSVVSEVLLSPDEVLLIARISRELKRYGECLEKQRIRDGLKHILSVSRLGNGHMQMTKPWELVKNGDEQRYVITNVQVHVP